MKTPMQEYISDSVNGKRKEVGYYLEKEKQQIIDAYKSAEDKSEFFEYEHRYGRQYHTCEDYYNETFKSEL